LLLGGITGFPALFLTEGSRTLHCMTVKTFFKDLREAQRLNKKTNNSNLLCIQSLIQYTKFFVCENWQETAQLHPFTQSALYRWQSFISRIFEKFKLKFPKPSRTKLIFQKLLKPGKSTKKSVTFYKACFALRRLITYVGYICCVI